MALLLTIPLLFGGCGGISASKTISPLDFLLPGILRNDPPQTNAPVVLTKLPVQIAPLVDAPRV